MGLSSGGTLAEALAFGQRLPDRRRCTDARAACFKSLGAPKTISLAKNLPPTPNFEPAAIALTLLSKCPPADSPTHAPAPPPSPKPDPFAPQHPGKTVTLLRHPCSGPATQTSYRRPTTGPRLRHFSPRIRPDPAISPGLLNHTDIRATLAQARDRPRGPESLPPIGIHASGIRTGILCERPVAATERLVDPAPRLCPTLPRGATHVPRYPAPGITDSRRTGDTLSYEAHSMSQKLTDLLLPACPGVSVLRAPGNLKRPRGAGGLGYVHRVSVTIDKHQLPAYPDSVQKSTTLLPTVLSSPTHAGSSRPTRKRYFISVCHPHPRQSALLNPTVRSATPQSAPPAKRPRPYPSCQARTGRCTASRAIEPDVSPSQPRPDRS